MALRSASLAGCPIAITFAIRVSGGERKSMKWTYSVIFCQKADYLSC